MFTLLGGLFRSCPGAPGSSLVHRFGPPLASDEVAWQQTLDCKVWNFGLIRLATVELDKLNNSRFKVAAIGNNRCSSLLVWQKATCSNLKPLEAGHRLAESTARKLMVGLANETIIELQRL